MYCERNGVVYVQLPRCDDGNGQAPPAIEPAGRIGDEWRNHRRFTQQANQNAVRDIKALAAFRLRRHDGAQADHDRSEENRLHDPALVHP